PEFEEKTEKRYKGVLWWKQYRGILIIRKWTASFTQYIYWDRSIAFCIRLRDDSSRERELWLPTSLREPLEIRPQFSEHSWYIEPACDWLVIVDGSRNALLL